jgi:endonuclease III
MKNSKKYAQGLQKLYRSLKQKSSKVKAVIYDDMIEVLVRALMLEYMTESATRSAFRRFNACFVDFNDMRVSRPDEIIEMLGNDNKEGRTVSANIIKVLDSVYLKYNTMSLESLKKTGKRPARAILEKFDGITLFCVDYIMLTALGGHAIPLTERMVALLREQKLVYPNADVQEIEGFLTRQISASNAYEFYSLLRHEAESKRRAKVKKKKTTKKKAAKKKN